MCIFMVNGEKSLKKKLKLRIQTDHLGKITRKPYSAPDQNGNDLYAPH